MACGGGAITGRLAAVVGEVVGMTGCAEGCCVWIGVAGAAAVPAGCGWLPAMFTVAKPLAFGATDVAGATLAAGAAPWPDRLIVLVCRSRSGAAGMARLTDWSVPVDGGLLEKNIGTNRIASATRTAAPKRRVFKIDSRQPACA